MMMRRWKSDGGDQDEDESHRVLEGLDDAICFLRHTCTQMHVLEDSVDPTVAKEVNERCEELMDMLIGEWTKIHKKLNPES